MKYKIIYTSAIAGLLLTGCGETSTNNIEVVEVDSSPLVENNEPFNYVDEAFGDIQMLRYQINGFDKLTLKQQKLVYYLYEAGTSGRDMIWDQNYRHNLAIRTALEGIVENYNGDTSTEDWSNFKEYTKRVWFSNGIHHHYSMDKFKPAFSQVYFETLLADSKTELNENALAVIFNDEDSKRVSLDDSKDLILGSATNFYQEDITEADLEKYYATVIDKSDETPVEYGLNSKLVKAEDGTISEQVWKVGGMYNDAIVEVVKWLELAQGVAENDEQAKALGLLVDYYKTGDLKKWSEFNIVWSQATSGDIDYIQGFVEVYGDPMGMRGSYESIVQIKDFEASGRMKTLADNVQWFEDNSSIMEAHKKPNVVGVTYNVVNVAGESGDSSPSTPIGVNLPNSNWIRTVHGSKAVSLGNIVESYSQSGGEGMLEEFAHDKEEIERSKAHGKLASKLHTAMHEVIGHASGRMNKGVGTPKETLKNFSSTLEEARADLVALYFLMDTKLVDLGLMESLEVGKAEYDSYIRNGMMAQMTRLEPGANLEEAHMRNRQIVASWAFEKGAAENVIEKIEKDGKTYFEIHDYVKLKAIFGDLLQLIQRIKSEGDYEAGKALVYGYGVYVDKAIHEQVLARSKALNIPPYNGMLNPILTAIKDADGNITSITVVQPENFESQMLGYSKNYGFLK